MSGRRALVTGASRGIGRATALELHRRGWQVIATARSAESLSDLPVAEKAVLDVTDDQSVSTALQRWGAPDLLVNNAGVGAGGPVESTPVGVAHDVFDVNVLGVLRMYTTFGAAMRRAGHGTIVTMSSAVGRVALPLAGVYSASKFAVEGLSDTLAVELRHFGVNVVLLEPGFVSTGAFEAFAHYFPKDADAYRQLAEHLATGDLGSSTPEDVARAVADAAEQELPPSRVAVGDSATQLLAAREIMDDKAFHDLYRATFTPAGW